PYIGLPGSGPSKALAQKEEVKPVREDERRAWKGFKYIGADNCKQCHATPGPRGQDFVLLNEYTTWKSTDRHALAYAVLEEERGRRISRVLSNDESNEKFVLDPKAGCLNCHALNFPDQQVKTFDFRDGINCDGCHGPSSGWNGPHSTDI